MSTSNPSLPSVPAGLHVDELKLDAGHLLITARSTAGEAVCPSCRHASARVHSSYWRTMVDLPWQGRAVTWRLRVRRFRCRHCPGRIFAERMPSLGNAKARRSDRLAAAQTDIGLVLGGEAGARLSRRLAMPVSGDTVLRLIRRRGIEPCPPPRVVGVDDWAWRRGRCYGTIICDLERRRVVDLLPGRAAGPLRDWLAAHPGIQVVSRDRAGPYAEAARIGAPAATQVADRWHLFVNASDALRGLVERHQAAIRGAAHQTASNPPTPAGPAAAVSILVRDSRRRARCEAVLQLHGKGVPVRNIVRRLGVSRNSVRRWLRSGEFVPYRRARGPSLLDAHLPIVEARWRDGQRNATVLHRELQEQGFAGGYDIVRRWVARRRRGEPARPPSVRIPSSRRITRWLTADPAALSAEEGRFVEALVAAAPGLGTAAEQVRAFAELMRRRHAAGFGPWLRRCRHDRTPRLCRRSTAGRDRGARGDCRAVEQRPGRGAGEPPQADQAQHVRPRQVRPVAPACPARRMNDPARRRAHRHQHRECGRTKPNPLSSLPIVRSW